MIWIHEKSTRVSDSSIVEEFLKSDAGALFEVATKGAWGEMGDGCGLISVDGLVQMGFDERVDGLEPIQAGFLSR